MAAFRDSLPEVDFRRDVEASYWGDQEFTKRYLPAERAPRGLAARLGGEVAFSAVLATLHVHLDESGNFHFRPKGSKYFIFTAAWTYDPAPVARDLTALRFSLLKQGHNLQRFHTSEDRQVNRDAVVDVLTRHANWQFGAVVVEKAKVYPKLYPPHRFYPEFAVSMFKFIFHRFIAPETTPRLGLHRPPPCEQVPRGRREGDQDRLPACT